MTTASTEMNGKTTVKGSESVAAPVSTTSPLKLSNSGSQAGGDKGSPSMLGQPTQSALASLGNPIPNISKLLRSRGASNIGE